jgi:integrase
MEPPVTSSLWVRLREKGGKRHEMPCHHNLEAYLQPISTAAGSPADPKGPLFRTIGRTTRPAHHHAPAPGQRPRHDPPARRRRRGIKTQVGNHTFRATGITAYLKNGGSLENAAAMANHASTRTTQLYDRGPTR